MATKTISQLTALDNVSTNLSSTLFVVYDSESGTTRKATLSQIDTAIERTIQNVTSASVYANAAFVAANTANVTAYILFGLLEENVSTLSVYANGAFAKANTANTTLQSLYDLANTSFNGTANPNVNILTANTITSVNVISSNQITANNLTVSNNFTVSGVVVQWHQPVPLTSKGDPGDKAGYIAIDNDKIYRCVADYTDGTADIWRYINFTGGTWG